ncbi:hypothetical protein Tco_0429107 [Tanacetum coccineum]
MADNGLLIYSWLEKFLGLQVVLLIQSVTLGLPRWLVFLLGGGVLVGFCVLLGCMAKERDRTNGVMRVKGVSLNMTPLPPREQRHPFLRYQGLEYTDADIGDFEERLERIYSREIYQVQVVDFQRMPELMRDGPLVWELILEFLSTLRFGEVLLDLDAPDTIQFQLGGARRRLSCRQFILALGLHTREEMESPSFARGLFTQVNKARDLRVLHWKGDLHDYWKDISTDGDFLGPPPSYTLIRDPVLRLCHRMMAHSIAGRIQAPKKVTVTDLFYFRGLDVGLVNIPYLLARYLRRFTIRRKSGLICNTPIFTYSSGS